ncbi:MAG TPA: ABC transporter ATP-binding protein [Candidatus Hydrogenedentes bacterium]|nr:ABC transporter ATP-binding protein [Candidatus Hydrogenedentota bacterium]
MTNSIETKQLSREFDGFWAVDDLDLTIEPGMFYGFLGRNGAGKSTTIKMLTGLLAPSIGTIKIFGKDLEQEGLAIKQRIGVVPEDLCLFENLTAHEYLTFIGRMYSMDNNTIAERREELLALFKLDDAEKTLILEFSHGMRKKISVAAALIHDPELLFLDEPFEGMDAIAARTLRTILESFIARDATVFLTSHILEIVEKLCTHVGIIHEGKLVSQSTLKDLALEGTLENAFIETVGDDDDEIATLSWLGKSEQ